MDIKMVRENDGRYHKAGYTGGLCTLLAEAPFYEDSGRALGPGFTLSPAGTLQDPQI
jgi:hypothetical protein